MIKKLQRRFIRIALVSLTVAMVLVLVIVNLSNWISVRNELKDTARLIADTALESMEESAPPAISESDSKGTPPPKPEGEDSADAPAPPGETGRGSADNGRSPALPSGESSRGRFGGPGSGQDPGAQARERISRDSHARNMVNESSWFSVTVDQEGSISLAEQNLTDTEEDTTLLAIAEIALDSGHSSGFSGDYVYVSRTAGSQTSMVFLNGETRLTAARTLMLISAASCVGGILLAWLLVTLASRRAVEPTLKNMAQQKQFITDASHELKTPLTVISTSMELLQTELPDNPWVRSTQKQTAAMRHLVDEMVYLSRMEEENPNLTLEPLRVLPLLEEAAEPFIAMAEFAGRVMRVEADGDLWVSGDRAMLQRLLSTLCDNAVKYAAGEGEILVQARPEGRQVALLVSNPVAAPLSREQCAHLFDRFYRRDPSRNKEKKSGYGIGLAIAAAIAENHGGSISAAMSSDGQRLIFTCLLPKASPHQLI